MNWYNVSVLNRHQNTYYRRILEDDLIYIDGTERHKIETKTWNAVYYRVINKQNPSAILSRKCNNRI